MKSILNIYKFFFFFIFIDFTLMKENFFYKEEIIEWGEEELHLTRTCSNRQDNGTIVINLVARFMFSFQFWFIHSFLYFRSKLIAVGSGQVGTRNSMLHVQCFQNQSTWSNFHLNGSHFIIILTLLTSSLKYQSFSNLANRHYYLAAHTHSLKLVKMRKIGLKWFIIIKFDWSSLRDLQSILGLMEMRSQWGNQEEKE